MIRHGIRKTTLRGDDPSVYISKDILLYIHIAISNFFFDQQYTNAVD